MKRNSFLISLLGVAIGLGLLCAAEPSSQSPEEKTVPLTGIAKRCEKMLLIQIIVNQGTTRLHTAIQANPDKKPSARDKETAIGLSVKQKTLIGEASAILDLLNKDGTAVALAEVFKELRGQMNRVQANLEKSEVGPDTQKMQTDIAETLKDLLAAVKPAG